MNYMWVLLDRSLCTVNSWNSGNDMQSTSDCPSIQTSRINNVLITMSCNIQIQQSKFLSGREQCENHSLCHVKTTSFSGHCDLSASHDNTSSCWRIPGEGKAKGMYSLDSNPNSFHTYFWRYFILRGQFTALSICNNLGCCCF